MNLIKRIDGYVIKIGLQEIGGLTFKDMNFLIGGDNVKTEVKRPCEIKEKDEVIEYFTDGYGHTDCPNYHNCTSSCVSFVVKKKE